MATWIADNRVGPTQYAALGALIALPNYTGTLAEVEARMPSRPHKGVLRAAVNGLHERGLIIHQCRDRDHLIVLGCEITITAHGLESRCKGGAERYRRACKLMASAKR